MNIFQNPTRDQWAVLVKRPVLELDYLESTVRNIINRVRQSGDHALKEMTMRFDKVQLTTLRVDESEIEQAAKTLATQLKEAIQIAAQNIESFHQAQLHESTIVETMPGVQCWRKAVPIDTVGIYIPSGTAPLFSTVLMLAIPARIAGCREVILCSPPDHTGKVHPAILFAAQLTGVTKLFKIGGAQAIGAMAYGTESVPSVSKIFGPGNQYVTKAKQLVSQEGIAIDLPAGPSEVLVWADETAVPSFVAADLLSQAEHGTDSQVMLVLRDEKLLAPIWDEMAVQLKSLPRKEIAELSLRQSRVILMDSEADALDFINGYAPEHLIINTKNADALAEKIRNAGSVFIGNYSPEAAGDYATGTNHTLPTNGYAKAFSGVSVESFQRYITFQKLSEAGIRHIGPVVQQLAGAEQLEGHRQAITARLNRLKLDT